MRLMTITMLTFDIRDHYQLAMLNTDNRNHILNTVFQLVSDMSLDGDLGDRV